MIADALIPHWVVLVKVKEAGPDVFRRAVQWLVKFFYADDVLLASPRMSQLQASLNVQIFFLTGWASIPTF